MSALIRTRPARSILGLALIGWISCFSVAGALAAGGSPEEAKGKTPGVAAPRHMLPRGQLAAQGPVESITGTVARMRSRARGRARAAGRPAQIRGSHFLLQAPKETVTVRAGPFRYRRRQGFEIHVGDELQVKGWRLGIPGKAIMVAGEIKKGSRVLKLRDGEGRPLWLLRRMQGRLPARRPAVTPHGPVPTTGAAPSEKPADVP